MHCRCYRPYPALPAKFSHLLSSLCTCLRRYRPYLPVHAIRAFGAVEKQCFLTLLMRLSVPSSHGVSLFGLVAWIEYGILAGHVLDLAIACRIREVPLSGGRDWPDCSTWTQQISDAIQDWDLIESWEFSVPIQEWEIQGNHIPNLYETFVTFCRPLLHSLHWLPVRHWVNYKLALLTYSMLSISSFARTLIHPNHGCRMTWLICFWICVQYSTIKVCYYHFLSVIANDPEGFLKIFYNGQHHIRPHTWRPFVENFQW